jgi:outer membrane protein insertion porin family
MTNARVWIALVFFAAVIPSYTSAQNESPQEKPKISAIKVEGNIKSDADLIVIATGLSVGQEFGVDDIQKAIQNLWDMNVFKDVQVYGEKKDDGVLVILAVKEYPRLEAIEISGSDKIEEKDVRQKIGLFTSQTVSPQHIKKASERVKKAYADQGYLNAKVEIKPYSSTTDTDKVLLKVKIEEGDKVKIRGIHFHGNQSYNDSKLAGTFDDTKAKTGFFKWFKSGDYDEKKYKEDLKRLIAFYKKNGFRDMQMTKDSMYYAPNNKDLYLDIWVDEGVKYYIGNITWTGNTLFSGPELSAALAFDRGDIFNQEKYDKSMQERVNSLYYDKGYIYAQIVPVEKALGKDTLNLDFIVTEGNQVYIDKVEIKNNTKTKEKVIRRDVVAFPGDKFSRDALIRTQRNLMVLNYFENVIPDVQPTGPDKVNVVVTVTEKPTDTANLSMGYSAQDGLIGSAGVAFNNFLGNGQVVNLNMQLGGQGYRVFSVGFSEPFLFGTRTSFGTSLYYSYDGNRRAQLLGYKSKSYGGSLSFGRRLKWPDDYFSASWSVSYSNSTLKPLTASNLLPQFAYGVQKAVTVSQVIMRDSRDAAEFPRTGSTYSLAADMALVNVDTTGFANTIRVLPKNYMRYTFRAQNFVPLFWSFVFYTDFEAGYARTFRKSSTVEEIPQLSRFYMGGGALDIGSIQLRGYSGRGIGPKDQGYPVGGATMFKYSAEIRLPVIPSPTMYLLGFMEAGNVFRSLGTSDPLKVQRSVGYGFRIYMPLVGVIGLDVGYGLDRTNKSRSFPMFHFQLGQQF